MAGIITIDSDLVGPKDIVVKPQSDVSFGSGIALSLGLLDIVSNQILLVAVFERSWTCDAWAQRSA